MSGSNKVYVPGERERETIQPVIVAQGSDEQGASTRTKPRLYALLAALYLVLFIAALDRTIVATAIPTISASLQSASGYTWIGSAYVLATAAAGPIWAKCSDIWGRKIALLASVSLFAASSVMAATSNKMAVLIAARALQGTAGGGMSQLVSITISDLFSMRARALYIGFMGLMWAVAGSAGPLVGGALTELASWRWIFWINLPVCGLALIVLVLFLDVHNPRTKLMDGLCAIDWFGTMSLLAVTILVLLGLDFGGAIFPWSSPKVICLIAFGVAAIGIFVFGEKRLAKYPMVPMSMFNTRSNNAVFIVAIIHSMVSIGAEYYLPLYFQSAKEASPLRSGILILPMMITAATVDIISGILIHQTGRYRELIWVGVVFMTLGTGLFIAQGTMTPLAPIVVFQIVHTVGIALMYQAPMIAIQNTVTQADTATATATLGLLRNMATALSIVIGGTVFQNGMAAQQHTLAETGLDRSVLEALSGDMAAANVHVIKSILNESQRRAVQDAFSWSIRNMFILYTGLSAVALAAAIFVKHQALRTEHTETKTGIKNMTERQNREAGDST